MNNIGVPSPRIYSVLVDLAVFMFVSRWVQIWVQDKEIKLIVRLELDLYKAEGEWGGKSSSA